MKKLIGSIFAIIIINSGAMAKSGFQTTEEIVINVSADELWEMIGPGFVDVYKWSSNVDHAEGTGQSEFKGAVCSERSCDVNVKGFSKISETLTGYDETNMSLTYEVNDGMPGFITLARNNWVVVPISDNQCKLVMNATFESIGLMGAMMNGMMRKKMGKTLNTVLNDAKIYAETGQISDEKRERVEALAKKAA